MTDSSPDEWEVLAMHLTLLALELDIDRRTREAYSQEKGMIPMKRDEILRLLRENEAALRLRGVAHVALFGSRARGDQMPGSDTDILVEFDPVARITVFDYSALKNDIAALFDSPVDVVNRDGLKPYLKPAAIADSIYAF